MRGADANRHFVNSNTESSFSFSWTVTSSPDESGFWYFAGSRSGPSSGSLEFGLREGAQETVTAKSPAGAPSLARYVETSNAPSGPVTAKGLLLNRSAGRAWNVTRAPGIGDPLKSTLPRTGYVGTTSPAVVPEEQPVAAMLTAKRTRQIACVFIADPFLTGGVIAPSLGSLWPFPYGIRMLIWSRRGFVKTA
jgi:hypothetical protein